MEKLSFDELEPDEYYQEPNGDVVLCTLEPYQDREWNDETESFEFPVEMKKVLIKDGIIPGSKVHAEIRTGNVYTPHGEA